MYVYVQKKTILNDLPYSKTNNFIHAYKYEHDKPSQTIPQTIGTSQYLTIHWPIPFRHATLVVVK